MKDAPERHREEALRAYRLGELFDCRWHLAQAKRIELARFRRQEAPILPSVWRAPDPEATDYLERMLLGVELGLLRWDPLERNWTKGRSGDV